MLTDGTAGKRRTSLRIAHTEASVGWGGQEIRILEEAQGMIARGHEVEIWAVAGSGILAEAARRALPHRALSIGRKNLRGILAMRRALASVRPDLVNAHSSTDAWLAALARLTLADAPPLVRTRHISAPVPDNFPTRWLYNHATRHIVTTGERLRETLVAENRFREDRITSVPTGVDSARFRPGDKAEARRMLGLDARARYVGIVATLRSWKGHLYLIEAFARLAAGDATIRLIVVGDGPMRPAIAEKITELNLAPNVVLAGRQDAVERWFHAMDVFCLPSYANEGVPQAIVQAMLCELPVVTTPVGSIVEAVTDQETALLVAPRDVGGLAAAIRRLLDDPALAQRMGRAARAQAERRFGRDTMIARMEVVFRGVVDRHRARRTGIGARWERLRRSFLRRWKEWRLPRAYTRLGTKYGGWWIDCGAIGADPLMIDCGLGRDVSFPAAFLAQFGGRVIGIDPSPDSLAYCRAHTPAGMEVWGRAFWIRAGETPPFFLPRSKETLPPGADGVSGSLVQSHAYVEGGPRLEVTTTSFDEVLARAGRGECDVLKLDIEGAEYEVLDDLCARGLLGKVRQLLVEFHHRATHHTLAETEAVVARIEKSGFHLVHVEGRNHVFRREDLG